MADRKKRLKLILSLICILGIAAPGIVFLRFKKQQVPPVALPESATKALMSLAQIHQTATKDGKIEWELDAQSAQLEADSGRMILKAPVIEFIMADGGKVHLTAESGVLNTRSNDMQVNGNVSLQNDRYTLTTQALDYNHADRILSSDHPVQIKSRAFDLRADKMTYNLNSNLALFDGQVEGILSENTAF